MPGLPDAYCACSRDVPLIPRRDAEGLVPARARNRSRFCPRCSRIRRLRRVIRDSLPSRRAHRRGQGRSQERAFNEINTGVLAQRASKLRAWLARLRPTTRRKYYRPTHRGRRARLVCFEPACRQRLRVLGVRQLQWPSRSRASREPRGRAAARRRHRDDPARLAAWRVSCGRDVCPRCQWIL